MSPETMGKPFEAVDLAEFGRRIREGGSTIEHFIERYLKRLKEMNGPIGAYVYIAEEESRESARGLDALLANGIDLGPLMGVPVAVKDLFAVSGMPGPHAGSRIDIADCVGSEGSLVRALKRAGCIVIGKTRTVEFGAGAQNLFQPTPWNPRDATEHLTPGGSSHGSAVAIAADLCGFSIGTDTGGSVRLPAAYCGVFGFKPTDGRWPMDGIFPLCPPMDTAGLLTKHARDARLVYDALTDSTAKKHRDGFEPFLQDLSQLTLAAPDVESLFEVDPEVAEHHAQVLKRLEREGAKIVERPWLSDDASSLIADIFARVVPTDLTATLGQKRLNANRARIDPVALDRLDNAAGCTAVKYVELLRAREQLFADAMPVMRGVDAVVTPTSPILPRRVQEMDTVEAVVNFAARGLSLTRVFNVLGLCAATMPLAVGSPHDGVVGTHVACRPDHEATVLRISEVIEGHIGVADRCYI